MGVVGLRACACVCVRQALSVSQPTCCESLCVCVCVYMRKKGVSVDCVDVDDEGGGLGFRIAGERLCAGVWMLRNPRPTDTSLVRQEGVIASKTRR